MPGRRLRRTVLRSASAAPTAPKQTHLPATNRIDWLCVSARAVPARPAEVALRFRDFDLVCVCGSACLGRWDFALPSG